MDIKRKPNGYWNDFFNVKRELLDFIQEHGTRGLMPTLEELKKVGRSSLAMSIQKHGGAQSVAERLGVELSYTAKQNGYWKDFANVERELLAFIKKHGTPRVMPTNTKLQKAGQSSLSFAIHKHGGCQSVAERLGLTYTKKRHHYWDEFANVERELLSFIEEHGTLSVMPTHRTQNSWAR